MIKVVSQHDGVVTIRLRASAFGKSSNSALSIDGSVVRLYMPNVLVEEWVVPRNEVSWLSGDGENPPIVPAIIPRMLLLTTNREFHPNTTLFFSEPQRMVPRTKKVIGRMPISVEESLRGVWADGVLITVDHRKRADAALRATGLAAFPSLPLAVAHFYGTLQNPIVDMTRLQPPIDARGGEGLIESGGFWLRPEPVTHFPC
jgi:hypothetical protein